MSSPSLNTVLIPAYLKESAKNRLFRCAPLEACGLLTGSIDKGIASVVGLHFCENVSASPERLFEIDPKLHIKLIKAEREDGPRLIGLWHSHLTGDASPSITDAEMADNPSFIWWITAERGGVAIHSVAQAPIATGQSFRPLEFVFQG